MFSYLKKTFSKTSSSKSRSKSSSSAKPTKKHSKYFKRTSTPKTAPKPAGRSAYPSRASIGGGYITKTTKPSAIIGTAPNPKVTKVTPSNRSTSSNSMLLGSPVLHATQRFTNQLQYGMNDEAKAEYDRLSRSESNWANISEAERVRAARKPQMDKQLPHAYINNPSTPAQVAHAKANPNYNRTTTSGGPLVPMPIGKNPNYDASGGIPYGTGDDPFTQAANVALMGTKLGIDEQRRQFDLSREDALPYMQAGQSALTQQQALLGLSGADAQKQAMAQFQESPGQKFLRERQERALTRNASAMGGLGGGNVRTALQEQAAGIAGQQFGDYQNRLAGLSGQGQTAVNAQGVLGANKAGQISNLYTQGGQARASGILGQQQANAARSTRNNQMLMGALGGGLAGAGVFGPQLQQGAGGNFMTGALLGLL